MSDYFYNQKESRVYTEREMNRLFSRDDDRRCDGWLFIGRFKSRSAAESYARRYKYFG